MNETLQNEDLNKYFQKQMQNEEFRKEYNSLEPQYEIVRQLIKERNELNLTQKQLAERVGMKQSNISRLERGNYNPSMDLLQKSHKH